MAATLFMLTAYSLLEATRHAIRKLVETLSLQSIVDYAGGCLRQGDPCLNITGITTDTRQVRPGELFLALKGENFDGHDFVAVGVQRGMAGAIVRRGFSDPSLPTNHALIEVEDTLLAFQKIAGKYRENLKAKVIAITGSNGKTSTKDFTAAVLSRKYEVLKTEGNLNNHIGVPQTLLRASYTTEIIVAELGMNHPGEIAPLARMARPDVGIITNIGTAHIEFMGSREGIALEKGMLAEAIGRDGYVILSARDDFSKAIAARTSAQVIEVNGECSDLRAEEIVQDGAGSRFTLVADGTRLPASVPVPGRHMINNALLAIAAGQIHGVALEECVAALSDAQLTKGRMEWKNVHGFRVLDDSYNANPDSMVAALETLSRMPTTRKRIAVLGRMGELGSASEAGHRQVGEAAAREKIDLLIGVGSEAAMIVQSAQAAGLGQAVVVPGIEQAAERLRANVCKDDIILIKGSRSAAMERIIPLLTDGASAIPAMIKVP